jgi:type II secretory pathway component PulF
LADALEDLVSRTDEHLGLAHRMRVAFTYPLILAVFYLASHATITQVFAWVHQGENGDRMDAGGFLGSGILGLLLLIVVKPHTLLKRNRALGRWLNQIADRVSSTTKSGRLLAAREFLAALSHVIAAGVPLPAAIRRVASTAGDERLERDLVRAAAALDEGIGAESAWRRTWLPEFAIVSISSGVNSSPDSQARALQHSAAECRRRWLQRTDRSLAIVPLLCIAAIGVLMAIDFAELQQMQIHVAREVQLW